jgi:hypothetical protein
MSAEDTRTTFAEQLTWPDERLLRWATEIVGVPKEAPADSFVLHAPLELMARAALLPLVSGAGRDHARERLVWMVATYEAAGASVVPPVKTPPPASVERAIQSLLQAIEASDLDDIDRFASWLGKHGSADEVRRGLAPALAPSLAAAAHGSIALHLLGRSPHIDGSVLRGVAREIGRNPHQCVAWEGLATGSRPLVDPLLEAPMLGMPESSFIFPMVANGAESARRILADVSSDPVAATRALSRVAAWSMLQDTSAHAPYGWTHTLSIPQAVMHLGLEPVLAVSVAASQVMGFRASMGTRVLERSQALPDLGPLDRALLASRASKHFDAHLVKYTLACFDAADRDPEMAQLYLTAATHLADWWEEQPDDGFFTNA